MNKYSKVQKVRPAHALNLTDKYSWWKEKEKAKAKGKF